MRRSRLIWRCRRAVTADSLCACFANLRIERASGEAASARAIENPTAPATALPHLLRAAEANSCRGKFVAVMTMRRHHWRHGYMACAQRASAGRSLLRIAEHPIAGVYRRRSGARWNDEVESRSGIAKSKGSRFAATERVALCGHRSYLNAPISGTTNAIEIITYDPD